MGLVPPFTGDMVTLAAPPEQIFWYGPLLLAPDIPDVTFNPGVTGTILVMLSVFELAGLPVGQRAFEVYVHMIISPSFKDVVGIYIYSGTPVAIERLVTFEKVPEPADFTFHWYDVAIPALDPPLFAKAENEPKPSHKLVWPLILTLTGRFGFTVTVVALEAKLVV